MSKLKHFDGSVWKVVNGQVTGDTLPIGSMVPYGSTTPPTNWLVCDGSAVSRTTYAELFAVIGTSYGAGDGSTTFNLPDKRGRKSVGYNSNDTDFNAIGKKGGEKTHQLTVNEMPSHAHRIATQLDGSGSWWTLKTFNEQRDTGLGTYWTSSTGGDQPHNNEDPYETDCWVIKAFQSSGTVANVANDYSTSQTDTYSCDYANDNFDLKPTVLFTGSSRGNITLSDSAANYKYLKILYRNGDGYAGTIDVLYPQNIKTILTLNYYNTGTNKFMHWAGEIFINETTITHTIDYYYENSNGSINAPQTINYIDILAVLGYK